MAEDSNISWTDHTFNPWRGCTKVSEGCAHCYAETLSKRNPAILGEWGPGKPRVLASTAMWKQPLKWNEKAAWLDEHWHEGHLGDHPRPRRPRVFSASLADWLDEEIPPQWLARLLRLIGSTPALDWQLLTKRPQNWSRLIEAALLCQKIPPSGDRELDWAVDWIEGRAIPPNVWMGTTVENQARAEERIPALLRIPAGVRFLSCEPLLGPVNMLEILINHKFSWCDGAGPGGLLTRMASMPWIHWLIIGGESGGGRRPFDHPWADLLASQCRAAGIACYVKQDGHALPGQRGTLSDSLWSLKQFPAVADALWSQKHFPIPTEMEREGPQALPSPHP